MRAGRDRDGEPDGEAALSHHPHRRRDGIDPAQRSRSRRRALQAVYAMQLSGANAKNAIAQFAHEQAHEVADLEYFEDLVSGVEKNRRELDAALQPFLDRGIEEVDPIERAMLRISAYELQHRLDVPYRVIIAEALMAVKRFGSEHGHTYVNGVLDRAAAAWRAPEKGTPSGPL
jgi:N utilization substance protein B